MSLDEILARAFRQGPDYWNGGCLDRTKELKAALAAAGYKIMAREPTEAMKKASDQADYWDAEVGDVGGYGCLPRHVGRRAMTRDGLDIDGAKDRELICQIKRSGMARWNRLRTTLSTALKHTSIHFDDISIETMVEMRDLVNDISQQFHETNACRNSYLAAKEPRP